MTQLDAAALRAPDAHASQREPGSRAPAVTHRSRITFAVLVAVLSAGYVAFRTWHAPSLITDLDHLLFATRVLLDGRNPYLAVGPGREFEWPFPLYYPAPALMLVAPLTFVPMIVARALFAAVSAGVLAYALTRAGWARVPLFFSAAFVVAVGRNQWSPLLLAACVFPVLGFVIAAKPNVGLSALAGQRSLRTAAVAVAAAAAATLGSLFLRPTWPFEWLQAIGGKSDALVPAAQWVVGGPLILFAVTRWRRAEARIVAALSLTPHSPFIYDTIPLFAVPQSARQALILALGTDAAMFLQLALGATAGREDAHMTVMARMIVLCVYLPCVAMLMRRQNVATPIDAPDTGDPATGRGRVDQALWAVLIVAFVLFVLMILALPA